MFDFASAYRERSRDPEKASMADLTGDGRVNEMDLFHFLRRWNEDRERSLSEGVP
jgi:hypothetical protein